MNDLAHLQTPAFLVDRNIVEQNCTRMREKARASGVSFRPHVKTHKTIEIGRMQHGDAIGPITVSTLAEAEFFAGAGFKDITYAFPIAPEKLDRAHAIAKRIDALNLLIDSEVALQAIEKSGVRTPVFLKVDCGYHRAGVDPDSDGSVRLAKAIAQSKFARLKGLLTHAGHSYDAHNAGEVREVAVEERSCVTRFREHLGMADLVRSVGSTPTMSVVDRFQDVDEVRPGNYVFFDAFQAAVGSCKREDVAVSVLATVVGSYPERGQAIIDAGALALSKDLGPTHLDPKISYGIVCDLEMRSLPMRLVSVSQEHGKIEAKNPPPVGTLVRVVPNHSCLTAAMFDVYHVLDRGKLVDEWRPCRGW
ncbi:MAG TPA: alanine racemase [Thermoanaerobaculia bacterium]|nr:alanine racemase [Thermoanaerobaculia bacterium]